ncbi:apolipoprotein N-acyltransferase [Rubritalea tangerina]|uniref:Apolipoprotein N-acyltransferase n=2 Tax=Rubritalea tangerina TaxID=430798 RepID=A0ABW4ZBA2_9BACT
MCYLASVLSGVFLAMCFPGFEYAPGMVWVWAVPLMAALWIGGGETKRKRYGFGVGMVAGLSFWLINLKWLQSMGDLPTVPVAGAFFGWLMLSAYVAVYFGLWGMLLASVGNPWRARRERVKSAIEMKMAEKEGEKKRGRKRVSGVGASLRVVVYATLHASSWVVLEWLRGWLMTGFGWNGVGVAFHEVPVMMQVADIVGVTGLSFLPIFLCSVVLQTGKRFIDELRAGKFQAHFEIAVTVGMIAVVFAYGVNRMSYYANQEARAVNVLLVQENIEQRMKWDEAQEVEHYQGYAEATERALVDLEVENERKMREALEAQSGEVISIEYPDFVIFPESAFTQPLVYVKGMEGCILLPLTDDLLRNYVLDGESYQVIFGSNMLEGVETETGFAFHPEGGESYNALAIVGSDLLEQEEYPTAAVQARGKSHLVPFGEYIPDIPFLATIMEWSSGSSYAFNFSASQSREPMYVEVKGESLGVIPSVCFEDTVGRLVRQFVRSESQMIVNITNDGWFGTSEAALQHIANSKFRSVELRRPMARAANTGVSGIVDVMGTMRGEGGEDNVIGSLENPFVKGTLYAKVKIPEQPAMTVYAQLGDWFVVLCFLLAVAMGVVAPRLRCGSERG